MQFTSQPNSNNINNNFSPTHITVKCKVMYIGIKFVDAVFMSASVAKEKGYRVENNNGEGYEVTYEDGYKSWCPKHVFDKANTEVKNEELASTCKLMVSPDYKERFKAEFIQVKNRYEGLKSMIEKWDANNLPFVPICPRETYNFQLRAMKDYMDILVVRAKIEGVNL